MITLNEAIKRARLHLNKSTVVSKREFSNNYQFKLSCGNDEFVWVQYDTSMNHAEFTRFYDDKEVDYILGSTSFYRLSRSDISKLHELFNEVVK